MAKKQKGIGSYQVWSGAVKSPRTLKLNGVWIGVGGSVKRVGKPPHPSYVIREATPEEYTELAQRGCPLVKLVENDF